MRDIQSVLTIGYAKELGKGVEIMDGEGIVVEGRKEAVGQLNTFWVNLMGLYNFGLMSFHLILRASKIQNLLVSELSKKRRLQNFLFCYIRLQIERCGDDSMLQFRISSDQTSPAQLQPANPRSYPQCSENLRSRSHWA